MTKQKLLEWMEGQQEPFLLTISKDKGLEVQREDGEGAFLPPKGARIVFDSEADVPNFNRAHLICKALRRTGFDLAAVELGK